MSRTACSGSAVLSTIIALSPPVSAISGACGSSAPAMVRLMRCAVAVEPVKHTPETRASPVSSPPIRPPCPGSSCSAWTGTPASCIRRTPMAAIRLVASAGLASTALPAASAAAIWPVKMASGKFQGKCR